MECKYNKDIIYYKWIVINKKTQVEYLKRKELKDEICDKLCDRFNQRVCNILTSIPYGK
jgi:hypothetical protein